ncbi:MAG TPA: nitric oxide synthase [Candidatus Marinimicrobia bacterium]|nr:nitric oxide synthase [Candidatus Neomarinimicrobiota bacterium]
MQVSIIYDSVFGNTERIARAIGSAFAPQDVQIIKITAADPAQVSAADLLIVGSPTRGFKATPAINTFLAKIPAQGLKGIKTAAFDTRIAENDISNKLLRFLMKTFGYAAHPIATRLQKKGGTQVSAPEGFYVEDSRGPLKNREPERATEWAKSILSSGKFS